MGKINRGNIGQKDIKWMETDSADATRSVYHGYYHKVRRNYLNEPYNGNVSLCNIRRGICNDDSVTCPIEQVEQNRLKRDRVCKRCLKICDSIEIVK